MGFEGAKAFIFIIVLFGTFSYLLASMPSAILSNQSSSIISQANYFYAIVPEQFALGSGNFSSVDYKNITRDTPVTLHLSVAAPNDTDIYIDWQSAAFPYIEGIYNAHLNSGAWPYGYCTLDPSPITLDMVLNHVSYPNQSSILLLDSSKDLSGIIMQIRPNSTYSNLYNSYTAGHLQITIGIAKNYTQAQYNTNALMVAAQIMTFQSPDIDPRLNAIIALPLWALILAALFYVLKGWL